MKPNKVYLVLTEGAKNEDAESVEKYIKEKVSHTVGTTEVAGLAASVMGAVYCSLKNMGIELNGIRLTQLEENFAKKFNIKKEAEEINKHNLLRVSHVALTALIKKIEEKTKNISPTEKVTLQSIIQHIEKLQEAISKNLQEKSSFPVSIRGEERNKTLS